MDHLNAEDLARLVDDEPTSEEAAHLAACDACSGELQAMRSQTEALGDLPEIVPPLGDWTVLEAQLRSEGLLRDAGLFQRLGLAQTPQWMKVAAALVLFFGGTVTGAGLTTLNAALGGGSAGTMAAGTTVESAASAVRVAEQGYVTAVARYQELLALDGGADTGADPISRFAALEHLVMVSQAAVREAPGDPFLNGFLASAMAERDAAFRLVSAKRDNWY